MSEATAQLPPLTLPTAPFAPPVPVLPPLPPTEAVTHDDLTRMLRECAVAVDRVLLRYTMGVKNETPRFMLLLFADPGKGQYISNCDRREMIKVMRDTADRLESKLKPPKPELYSYATFDPSEQSGARP